MYTSIIDFRRYVVDPFFGTVVSSLGSLIGGSIQNSQNQKMQNAAFRHQEKMMDKANQFSYGLWNETNEYNTPLNKRKRLEEAGLNPIYYGLDGVANSQAFQSAMPSTPTPAHMENVVGPAANAMAQYPLLKAQIDNIKADTDKKKVEAEGQSLENEITNASKGDIIKWNNVQWRVGEASIENQVAQAKKASEETNAIQITLDNQQRALDLHEQEVNIKKIYAALDKMRLDKDLKQQAIDYFIAMQNLSVNWYNAKTNRIVGDAQAENYKSQSKLYDAQTDRVNKLLPFEISHAKNDLVLQYFNNIKANNEAVKVMYEAVKAAKDGLYGSDTMSQLCGTLDSLLGTLGLQTPGTFVQDEARSHTRFAIDPSSYGTTEPAYERWSH